MDEPNQFEKFMDDFDKRDSAKREKMKEYTENHSDSPQRKYNKLYRELWQNRIIYRNKANSTKK